jgi:hypothetical protein
VANQTYIDAAADILSAIAEYGRSMTLRSKTSTGTAWDPTLTNSDQTIKGVVKDYSAFEIDGTLVMQGDKKIILGATYAPTTAMKIVDGIEMSIVSVKEIKPGDTVLAYEVQVR